MTIERYYCEECHPVVKPETTWFPSVSGEPCVRCGLTRLSPGIRDLVERGELESIRLSALAEEGVPIGQVRMLRWTVLSTFLREVNSEL